MALTQRLEFRQGQSLVMTPQLLQAIKLLQLSNLELSAFVEEELERNPLLERDDDAPSRRSRAEADAERGEYSAEARPTRDAEERSAGRQRVGEGFEPAQDEWLSRDLGSRTEIEQTLDTGLDNVFPKSRPTVPRARAGCRAGRLRRVGAAALRRRRGLQSRGLCRRRD